VVAPWCSAHATGIGFIADYGKDGFGTAASGQKKFSGDYFLPGSPLEGWSVEYRIGSASAGVTRKINKGKVGYSQISADTIEGPFLVAVRFPRNVRC